MMLSALLGAYWGRATARSAETAQLHVALAAGCFAAGVLVHKDQASAEKLAHPLGHERGGMLTQAAMLAAEHNEKELVLGFLALGREAFWHTSRWDGADGSLLSVIDMPVKRGHACALTPFLARLTQPLDFAILLGLSMEPSVRVDAPLLSAITAQMARIGGTSGTAPRP